MYVLMHVCMYGVLTNNFEQRKENFGGNWLPTVAKWKIGPTPAIDSAAGVCVCVYVCMYIYIYIYMYACMCKGIIGPCPAIDSAACVCVCVYACMCKYMYVSYSKVGVQLGGPILQSVITIIRSFHYSHTYIHVCNLLKYRCAARRTDTAVCHEYYTYVHTYMYIYTHTHIHTYM